jgi:hypothetical protein
VYTHTYIQYIDAQAHKEIGSAKGKGKIAKFKAQKERNSASVKVSARERKRTCEDDKSVLSPGYMVWPKTIGYLFQVAG